MNMVISTVKDPRFLIGVALGWLVLPAVATQVQLQLMRLKPAKTAPVMKAGGM